MARSQSFFSLLDTSKIPVVCASAPPCPFVQPIHYGRSAPPQSSILDLRAILSRVERRSRRGKCLDLSHPTSYFLANQSKKRHSFVVHSVHNARRSTEQTPVAPISSKNDPCDLKSEGSNATALGQSTPGQTRSGSFTYSPVNSQMPSLGTPETSPSVQPVRTKDEDATPQTTPSDNPNAAENPICSSPTWEKDITRKERRATKRLEAERKDLEKRLLHLEEAQSRLENGIYDKNSRRLTKKQPFGSSKRSSSANSERPRSSGGFSSFFSGSRRSSRSRSSSVNGKDLDSRRQSTDNPAPSGPPSLPLVLPERFSAVISRELSSKHGTALDPAHLQQRSPHTLHSSAKSDDLRESWKMAEAWQKKNGRGSDQDLVVKPDVYLGSQFVGNMSWKYEPRSYPQPPELLADLDRDRFTATLKQERKLAESAKPSTGRPVSGPISTAVRPKNAVAESHQQASNPAITHVTTARQLRDIAPVGPDNTQVSPSPHGSPSGMLPVQASAGMPKRGRVDNNSHTQPRIYKSSPLALNPTNTNDLHRKADAMDPRASSVTQTDYLHVPQPLRVSKPYHLEEPRGRNRAPAVVYHPSNGVDGQQREVHTDQRHSFNGPMQSSARNDRRQENRPLVAGPAEPRQHMPGGARRQSHVAPPLKHPDRRLSKDLSARRLSDETYTPPPNVADTATVQEPAGHTHPVPTEPADNIQPVKVGNKPSHNRSASGTSIKTTSSYDTADEEVLDVPSHPSNRQAQASNNKPIKEEVPVISTPPEPAIIPDSLRDPPPLATGGPVTMLRRKPMQKVKPFEPNQVVAKLFVICCHCSYWHDLPSEIYAKLACPERLPSDSLLVRTFSRKNSLGRRNSIFSSKSKGPRQLPNARGVQGASSTQTLGTSQCEGGAQNLLSSQSTPLYRPQCCWCGHSMGKTCCQGWTTIVHMRERHH